MTFVVVSCFNDEKNRDKMNVLSPKMSPKRLSPKWFVAQMTVDLCDGSYPSLILLYVIRDSGLPEIRELPCNLTQTPEFAFFGFFVTPYHAVNPL